MDDLYTIDTPENIEFAYDVAGIGSRFLAAIIDTALILIAEGLVLYVFGLAVGVITLADSILTAIAALLGFAILWGYYIIFELLWNGQSPGKRMIGLRTVREGGRPITFVSAAIRNFIRIVDFMPVFYGIGVLVMFIDRRARRLGDLAAGTLVVKERRMVSLESLTTIPVPASASSPVLPNIHLLNDQDYNLIQEFLRRRNELGREPRMRLGAQLASGTQARLGLPQGGDAELFLQQVVTEYQLHRRQS